MRGGIREREREVQWKCNELNSFVQRLVSSRERFLSSSFIDGGRIRRESNARANVMPDYYAQSLPRVSCFMTNETKKSQSEALSTGSIYICIYIYVYIYK